MGGALFIFVFCVCVFVREKIILFIFCFLHSRSLCSSFELVLGLRFYCRESEWGWGGKSGKGDETLVSGTGSMFCPGFFSSP